MKVVHFSDLHFGSGERYGSINPETGFNKRFEDFLLALDRPINFSIENNVDLVIFTGDTYKHAVPEPVYQREFAKRIKLLSKNQIPTVLLVGNHDVLYRSDGSNALDIYSALDVNHVNVFSKIELKNIQTKSGLVQIIALPHITKSKLLTKEEYRNLSSKEQDNLMLGKVKEAIKGCIQKLDPKLPAILIGHGTIESAQFGAEQDLSIGKVFSYPMNYFQDELLDYVGFGHIHRRQVLQEKNPLILYAGSLERVDFGEEKEEKSFVYLELEKGKPPKYEFMSTKPRGFITVDCDLTESQNPQKELEEKVQTQVKPGAIARIRYKIKEENAEEVDNGKIKTLLSSAFASVIQPEIIKKERTYRISELDSSLIGNPIQALEKYLFDYKDEEKSILLNRAKELISELNEVK